MITAAYRIQEGEGDAHGNVQKLMSSVPTLCKGSHTFSPLPQTSMTSPSFTALRSHKKYTLLAESSV